MDKEDVVHIYNDFFSFLKKINLFILTGAYYTE